MLEIMIQVIQRHSLFIKSLTREEVLLPLRMHRKRKY